jgi:hypothetical protein
MAHHVATHFEVELHTLVFGFQYEACKPSAGAYLGRASVFVSCHLPAAAGAAAGLQPGLQAGLQAGLQQALVAM